MNKYNVVNISRVVPCFALILVVLTCFGINTYSVSATVCLLSVVVLEVISNFDSVLVKSRLASTSWILIGCSICLLVPLKFMTASVLSYPVEILFLMLVLIPFSLFISDVIESISEEFFGKS